MTHRTPGGSGAPARERRRCPICGRADDARYRPFCSRRCADVDLGRWLTGGYAIPGEDAEDAASETAGARRLSGDEPEEG